MNKINFIDKIVTWIYRKKKYLFRISWNKISLWNIYRLPERVSLQNAINPFWLFCIKSIFLPWHLSCFVKNGISLYYMTWFMWRLGNEIILSVCRGCTCVHFFTLAFYRVLKPNSSLVSEGNKPVVEARGWY